MPRDTCIKAGSYCPVCRGMGSVDCWHDAQQFHAGSAYLDKMLKQKAHIERIEALNRELVEAADEFVSFIDAHVPLLATNPLVDALRAALASTTLTTEGEE